MQIVKVMSIGLNLSMKIRHLQIPDDLASMKLFVIIVANGILIFS